MAETDSITLFDDGREFQMKPATERLIQKVCGIMKNTDFLNKTHRTHYALIAEMEPDKVTKEDDGSETLHYTSFQTYGKRTYLPAIIQELFFDCPKLVEVKNGKAIALPESETFLRDAGYNALNFFFSSFGEMMHDAKDLSELYQNDLMWQAIEQANPTPQK